MLAKRGPPLPAFKSQFPSFFGRCLQAGYSMSLCLACIVGRRAESLLRLRGSGEQSSPTPNPQPARNTGSQDHSRTAPGQHLPGMSTPQTRIKRAKKKKNCQPGLWAERQSALAALCGALQETSCVSVRARACMCVRLC